MRKAIPMPMANIINGGKHADNKIDFQEFMIMPLGAEDASPKGIRMVAEIFHKLKGVLKKAGHNTATSAMRGASRRTSTTRTPSSSSSTPSTRPDTKRAETRTSPLALDCASSELYDEGGKKGYKFWKSNPDKLFSSEDDGRAFHRPGLDKYPIISIEDPLDQDDWDGYAAR